MDLTTQFQFGEKVMIDGDLSLIAVVTAYTIRRATQGHYLLVEVSYFGNGESRVAWVEETRLSRLP